MDVPASHGQERASSAQIGVEDDFYGWLLEQAKALRSRRFSMLDTSNLAEELEAMARSEERKLKGELVVLLKHLLKYRYQSKKISGSWESSIENSREEVAELLDNSPSLTSKIDRLFTAAYRQARRKAGAEMRMRKREWEKRLPGSCEWTLNKVRDQSFWPAPKD
jgi:septal ring factor EnvC (AmiA/AmiB activator)